MTLAPVRSKLLTNIPHGFFTRHGGVSCGVYSSLNCGKGSDDDPNHIMENRSAISRYFGHPNIEPQAVHQIHSSDVIIIDKPLSKKQRADAIVTATPGLTLSILTADCQPVLMYDGKSKIIGAAHAGWKGSKLGILQNTISAMETLGAKRSEICAVIGPCISQKAYEVGPEFYDEICKDDLDAARFFFKNDNSRYQFDLPGYGLSILQDQNIKECMWTGNCTYSDPESFYSYRRATHQKQSDYGRLINCISL
ncbi:MAG: peptidoglycan editing factor PgeF [Planktomarina sp.]|nr:peptidoglycan editing factor PgeF [Planktomarina sp.]